MSFLFNPLLGGGFGSGWDPRAVVGRRMLPAHGPVARSEGRAAGRDAWVALALGIALGCFQVEITTLARVMQLARLRL